MGTNIKYNAVMVADLADGVKTWIGAFEFC